ncbi:MAG: hypothetical protein JO069_22905 [Verrucomicrobia bacterium]|nr:hypothetical protein [Verrucomicrobiota bacterium]
MRKVQPNVGAGAILCMQLGEFSVPAALLDRGRRRFGKWNQSFLELVELAHDEIVTADVQSIFSFSPVPKGRASGARIVAAVIRNPSSARKPRTIVGMEHPAVRGHTSLLLAHGLVPTSPAFERGKQQGAHETNQELKHRLTMAIQRNLPKLTPMLARLLKSAPAQSRERAEIQKMVAILQKMQDFVRNDFDAIFFDRAKAAVPGNADPLRDEQQDRQG